MHDLVAVPGDDDDAGRALVHPQVERVVFGSAALRETEHVEREATPAVDVGWSES